MDLRLLVCCCLQLGLALRMMARQEFHVNTELLKRQPIVP